MEDRSKIRAYRRSRARHGFTLIEILVVVAIIALLVSILLPSLKKAREQAKAIVCASQIGNICRAETTYQTTNKEWIPGSPWTTGYWFIRFPIPAWDLVLPGFNRLALNMFDFETPLRAFMSGNKSVSRDRNAIFLSMSQEVFGCPSNPEIAGRYGTLPGPSFVKAVSYMSMTPIMCAGPDTYKRVSQNKGDYPQVHKVGHVAQSEHFSVYAPRSYVPRHSRLGRGSMKVFVADGLRYFDEGSGNITYNTETTTAKGNHCATPPSTGGTAWEFNREYNMARKLSYRHGNKDGMNAGFFDGHVELLRVDAGQRRFRGKAIDPRWYYPSGSVVRDPGELHKDTLPAGSTLP